MKSQHKIIHGMKSKRNPLLSYLEKTLCLISCIENLLLFCGQLSDLFLSSSFLCAGVSSAKLDRAWICIYSVHCSNALPLSDLINPSFRYMCHSTDQPKFLHPWGHAMQVYCSNKVVWQESCSNKREEFLIQTWKQLFSSYFICFPYRWILLLHPPKESCFQMIRFQLWIQILYVCLVVKLHS